VPHLVLRAGPGGGVLGMLGARNEPNVRNAFTFLPEIGPGRSGRAAMTVSARVFSCVVALLLAAVIPVRGELPRLVSLNLAADQLVLLLADRPQILAVTRFAADPGLSTLAEEARGLRAVRGEAEEVILLRPDVVFVGKFSAPQTTRFLRAAGLRLVEVHDPANSFDQLEENLRLVGNAVGHPGRAEVLGDRLRAARAAADALPKPEVPLRILPYELNTWSPGKGVLLHSLILEAGHVAVTDELGLSGYSQISLERVLLSRPDVILVPQLDGDRPALAHLLFEHPVWRHARAPQMVELPRTIGLGGGLDAAELLRSLRSLRVPTGATEGAP
jgi:iron complex transport system substrate-binding protein